MLKAWPTFNETHAKCCDAHNKKGAKNFIPDNSRPVKHLRQAHVLIVTRLVLVCPDINSLMRIKHFATINLLTRGSYNGSTCPSSILRSSCGHSVVVTCNLPKVETAGSNPVVRSNSNCGGWARINIHGLASLASWIQRSEPLARYLYFIPLAPPLGCWE